MIHMTTADELVETIEERLHGPEYNAYSDLLKMLNIIAEELDWETRAKLIAVIEEKVKIPFG